MIDEKKLIENAKKHYEKSYFIRECDFVNIVEKSKVYQIMDKNEWEAYNKGYKDAMSMKENADGCVGCAFEDVNEWTMPCEKCKRNSKDYWRAKKVE